MTAMNACLIASYAPRTTTLPRAKKQKPKLSPRRATRRMYSRYPSTNASNQAHTNLTLFRMT